MIAGLALALIGAGSGAFAQCAPDQVLVKGDFGQARFSVDLADSGEERAKGLMFVESMPTMSGMLFVYEAPQHATFWMRNTLIPLDMIFMDETGTITHIHPNAKPLDETIIDGGKGVLFVLEINGGLAKRLGLKVGDVLQHPSIGEKAAFPCDG